MNSVDVLYNGEQVSVPKEVAEFLEQDRKRALAQNKQDGTASLKWLYQSG